MNDKPTRYIDTCACLSLQERAFDEPFILSYITIQELENIKVSQNKDSECKYKSRNFVRLLDANMDKFTVCFDGKDECVKQGFDISNDNIILFGAYLTNKTCPILFITDDLLLKIKARNLGLNAVGSDTILCGIENYVGYKEISMSDLEMAEFYTHPEINRYSCIRNQYLLVKNLTGEITDKVKWNGFKYKPISCKPIVSDFLGKIKPLNVEQELAFDLLQDMETTIKILFGAAGTGKDMLMVSTAIQLVQKNKFNKILWVRNNVEVKNTKQIGFLPGDKASKLEAFSMIMADHLGGKDGLDQMISEGKIEVEHLGFLRGRSYDNCIIMCSESQDITTDILKMLIGRVGKNSMLWLNGDYRQTDDKAFDIDNGLQAAINNLKGQELFGCVNLCKVERSKTAQLAELLY